MKRFRTLLSVLLGLVLLVQGFAVSAAPRAKVSGKSESVESGVMADLPCHGQKAMKADDASKQYRACCNENCPDMTTCALGHLATVPMLSVALAQPVREAPSVISVRIVTRTFASPLRPPISLHS